MRTVGSVLPAPGGAGTWPWGVDGVTGQPALDFAALLRQLRGRARLTQEELAEAAGLSPRAVSDLERGIHRTARKDTALLLAGALGLAGSARGLFVAAARGRAEAGQVLAASAGTAASLPAVAAGSRPGAAAPEARRELLTNLPAQASSFIGRRRAGRGARAWWAARGWSR